MTHDEEQKIAAWQAKINAPDTGRKTRTQAKDLSEITAPTSNPVYNAYWKFVGGRPDKHRVIPYGVCDVCVEDPNTPSRVEDMVLHDLQVQ